MTMVELRTRPASLTSPQALSLRHGLRNSGLQTTETLLELAPHRRPRHAKFQSEDNSPRDTPVCVSSTHPNLVISNIKEHQWPDPPVPTIKEPAPKRLKISPKLSRLDSASPALTRRSSRISTGSQSPLKTRGASVDTAQPGVTTRAGRQASRRLFGGSQEYDGSSRRNSYLSNGLGSAKSESVNGKAQSPPAAGEEVPQSRRRSNRHISSQESSTREDVAVDAGNASIRTPSDLKAQGPSVTQPAQQTPKVGSVNHSIAATPQPQPRHDSPALATSRDPDLLIEADLPAAFLERPPTPQHFVDKAAKLHHQRYLPLPSLSTLTRPLLSHAPSTRKTETLFRLAQSTFETLKVWQDEYLKLEERTAPAQNPPRRPAHGGRQLVDEEVFEAQKEIDLWGHVLGIEGREYSKSLTQRAGYAGLGLGNGRPAAAAPVLDADGRRARRRGADAKLIDGVAPNTSDHEGQEKRTRKPVRRFDAGTNGATGRKRRRRGGFSATDDRPMTADDGVDEPSDADEVEDDHERPLKRGRLDELKEAPSSSQTSGPRPRMRENGRPVSTEPTPAVRGRRTRGGRGRGRGRGRRHQYSLGRKESTYAEDDATGTSGRAEEPPTVEAASLGSAPRKRKQPHHVPIQPHHATQTGAFPGVTMAPHHQLMPAQQISPVGPTSQSSPSIHAPVEDASSTPGFASSKSPTSQDAGEAVANGKGLLRAPKAKSEKRSSSMTAWWAERKRKAAEEKMRLMHEKGVPFVDGSAGFAASPGPVPSGNGASRNPSAGDGRVSRPPPVIVPAGYAPPPSDGKGMWVPIQYGPPPHNQHPHELPAGHHPHQLPSNQHPHQNASNHHPQQIPPPNPPPQAPPDHHHHQHQPPPMHPLLPASQPPPSASMSNPPSRSSSGQHRQPSATQTPVHTLPPPHPLSTPQQPPRHHHGHHGHETPQGGKWSFVWTQDKKAPPSFQSSTHHQYPPHSQPHQIAPMPERQYEPSRYAPQQQAHHHSPAAPPQSTAPPPVPGPHHTSQYPDGTFRTYRPNRRDARPPPPQQPPPPAHQQHPRDHQHQHQHQHHHHRHHQHAHDHPHEHSHYHHHHHPNLQPPSSRPSRYQHDYPPPPPAQKHEYAPPPQAQPHEFPPPPPRPKHDYTPERRPPRDARDARDGPTYYQTNQQGFGIMNGMRK